MTDTTPETVTGGPWSDFDRYCDEHGIRPGEEPAAFAAFLNERTGWDGPMNQVADPGAPVRWGVRHSFPDDHEPITVDCGSDEAKARSAAARPPELGQEVTLVTWMAAGWQPASGGAG